MSSQQTFQSRLGKFSDGITVLTGLTGYSPTKPTLQLTMLQGIKTRAVQRNSDVVTLGNELKALRDERRLISFQKKDGDENCIENRMHAIANYIKSENNEKHPAYLTITSIISKLNPPPEKKDPPAEGDTPKVPNSKSEKSFQSLVGFSNDVYTIITNLGTGYNPTNQYITLTGFKEITDRLVELNKNIVTSENSLSAAIKARADIYDGENGIKKTITAIKAHLASLEGGKKNPAYVAFNNAVK